MKWTTIFLFLLAIINSMPAQKSSHTRKQNKKDYKALVDRFFGDDDQDFKVRQIPDKWNKESAVIIAQKVLFDYRKPGEDEIIHTEIARRMIKIQDRAALVEFSEFYFSSSRLAGIGIIKENGDEVEVDMSAALKIEQEVSGFFKSYSGTQYYKIAVPNLEIGDIIDFYYVIDNEIITSTYEIYEPYYITLENEYPVITQVIDINIHTDFHFNFNSFNGAPELKTKESVNNKGNTKDSDVKSYTWKDINRESIKKSRWNYPFLESPHVKFQVFYFEDEFSLNRSGLFYGKGGIPYKKVMPSEISYFISHTDQFVERYLINSDSWQNNLKALTNDQIIETVYYTLRFLNFGHKHQLESEWDSLVDNPYRTMQFVGDISRLFFLLGVESEMLYFVPRHIGTINEVLFNHDLSAVVKVKYKGRDLFLSCPGPNTNIGEIPSEMEGVEIYELGYDIEENPLVIQPSSAELNKSHYAINVEIQEGMEKLELDVHTTHTGFNRYNAWSETVTPQNWTDEDLAYLTLGLPEKKVKSKKKKKNKQNFESFQEKMDRYYGSIHSMRKKAVEKALEIEIDEYRDYGLIQSGRFHKNPELEYSEQYTTKDLIQKAGNRFLISLGNLIGQQAEIGTWEYKRENNVYLNHARSTEHAIRLAIPEGYSVEGFESLNMDFSNETGSFVSTAQLDNGFLVVSASKVYNHHFMEAANWPKMTAFLDAAFNFTQKKVILKKL